MGGILGVSFAYLCVLSCLACGETVNYWKCERIQTSVVDTAIASEGKENLAVVLSGIVGQPKGRTPYV